jgi:hypothetical protein
LARGAIFLAPRIETLMLGGTKAAVIGLDIVSGRLAQRTNIFAAAGSEI